MTAALQSGNDLPAEAFALIREGTPKPKTTNSVMSPIGDTAQQLKEPDVVRTDNPEVPPPTEISSGDDSQEKEANKAVKPKAQKEKDPEPMASNALVSMTFRVPAELPGTLLRASADRKARRIRPFTQQEIMTEALSQWLKRNGYA